MRDHLHAVTAFPDSSDLPPVTGPQQGALRLAVLDADSGFVHVLSKRLESAGWQFRALSSAPRVEEIVALRLNAVLVDPSCLGHGGWDFLEELCVSLPGLGVIVCTGRSTVAQRVRGLRMGADDWITKPSHPSEVIARVEAVARRRRRARVQEEVGSLLVGELEIRPDRFQAFAAGRSAELTRREFEVLQLLVDANGQVLQREEIYQRVWGYAMAHGDRSVDVFVRKLRHKLERLSPEWTYIHTHFGIGYRFEAQARGADEHELTEPAELPVLGPAPGP